MGLVGIIHVTIFIVGTSAIPLKRRADATRIAKETGLESRVMLQAQDREGPM